MIEREDSKTFNSSYKSEGINEEKGTDGTEEWVGNEKRSNLGKEVTSGLFVERKGRYNGAEDI